MLTLLCRSGVCRAKAGEGVFTLLQHLSLRTSATQKFMNASFKLQGTPLRYTPTFLFSRFYPSSSLSFMCTHIYHIASILHELRSCKIQHLWEFGVNWFQIFLKIPQIFLKAYFIIDLSHLVHISVSGSLRGVVITNVQRVIWKLFVLILSNDFYCSRIKSYITDEIQNIIQIS